MDTINLRAGRACRPVNLVPRRQRFVSASDPSRSRAALRQLVSVPPMREPLGVRKALGWERRRLIIGRRAADVDVERVRSQLCAIS